MASQRVIRRTYHTTGQLASIIGRLGEFSVDITKNTLVLFDGETPGGIPLAKENHTHSSASADASGFMTATQHQYLYSHVHPVATGSTDGFMSAEDKTKLDGISGGGGGGLNYPVSTINTPNTLALRDNNGDFGARYISASKFVGPVEGNADTVSNGVYTTGSYSNPTWITGLDAAKLTGTIPGGVSFNGTVLWSNVTGRPTLLSQFTNDAGFINASGNTSGTAGGVLSLGGRETHLATARTVILRDSNARAQIAVPAAAADIANKQYVDAQAGGGGFLPYIHEHGTYIYSGQTLVFNLTVVDVSGEQGVIKLVEIGGYPAMDTSYQNQAFIEFIVDGITNSMSLASFAKFASVVPAWGRGPTTGFNSRAVVHLDMAYTSSCRIRTYTTATLTAEQINPYMEIKALRLKKIS